MKLEQRNELTKSEEQFRSLFENAPDAIFIADGEGIFTDVNENGERLLRYERGELFGKAIVDVLQPEEIARFRAVRKFIREGKTHFDEWKLICKDGTSVTADVSANMLPEKRFQAFVRDITKRKLREELSRRQTRHALLRADVQAAIASGGNSLPGVLQSSMEAIVRHLDAAFARVWTLDEKENILELQASAGIYTHIDGRHSHFQVGQYKIGKIAARKKSYFSNAILEIEQIDEEWAMREGLISFAGLPLTVNDEVVGVTGIFSTHRLTEDVIEAFESIAAVIAQGIVRKRAEDSVREKQELLQAIFDNSPELIHVKDLEGRCVMSNRIFQETLKMSCENIVGKTEIELWQNSPALQGSTRRRIENYRAFDSEVFETGKTARKEDVFTVDGDERLYSTTKCPLTDAEGKPYLICTISTDLTEIKHAEKELRANQELLQAIFDNTPSVINVKDLDGRYVMTNRSFEQSMGLTREEILGKTTYELWKLSPVFKDEAQENIDAFRAFELEAVRAGKAVQKENTSLFDGEEQTSLITKCPLTDSAGEPYSVLTIATNITEIKRSEKELLRLQTELAHASRVMTMGALTSSIAHEVNQPLAGVVTNGNATLRWLAIDPPELAEARNAVNRIIRDGNRASAVITRTRALLKKTPPQKMPLDMNEVARQTINLATHEAQKSKIFVQTKFSDKLPSITGDKIQIQQVLLNLLMNGIDAIKAVTNGETQLSVETRHSETDKILVAVTDSGIGLVADDSNRLFEAFYTTKKEGMGMGLSISRSIIEAHGGQLWATPNDGAGATFQFTLPVWSDK